MNYLAPLPLPYDPEKELEVARVLARTDLYFFSRYMFFKRRGFKWLRAKQHQIICDALMRVYRGECKRLIINVAPRYSKTELAVVNFIAWCIGLNPDCEFIHTSYSARLASNNSWNAREIVQSPEYKQLFPGVTLRDDSSAKDEWKTNQGGVVYSVGAEGTITGYGAGKMREGFGGAIIIDDPHKPGEILSETVRPKVIEWFKNTLESRKNSVDTPIILIMQRLHEEDLAGWLLAGGNGEEWEHVNIPAIQDDGTALWPEKHTIEDLRRMEQSSPWTFSSQYMQNPVPPEGGIFRPDNIEIIDKLPKLRLLTRAWDLAATQSDGDYTAGLLMGQTYDNRHVIVDARRLQGSPDKVEAAIVNTAKQDGPMARVSLPQDPGQAGKAQVAYLTRALSGFRVFSSPETGDKVTRAQPLASQINVGNVQMLRGEWNKPLLHELRNFPFAKYDDQVDAASRAFNTISDSSTYDSSMSWVGAV